MKRAILWIGSSLAALTMAVSSVGCLDAKSMGVSRWPMYEPPAALVFSDAEIATIRKWATEQPELFKKLQAQNNQWAALVNTHNKKALEINLKQLDALGHDENERNTLKSMWMKKYRIQE